MTEKYLGRGLSAFLETRTDEGDVIKINVDDIVRNPYQPRQIFDEESLQTLATSIKRKGVLQPILVVKNLQGNYQLVAGERRLRASKIAGLTSIPAIIVNMNAEEQLEVAILENIQREDLNPLEEAESYKRLIDEFHHTQEELSEILGKSRSHVTNILRLLTLPDPVKKMIREGKLTFGHARTLVGVEDAVSIAEDVVRNSLNVRQTESLVKNKKRPKQSKKIVDPEVLHVSEKLSSMLGLEVTINLKGSGGIVEISFENFEELDKLISKLDNLG